MVALTALLGGCTVGAPGPVRYAGPAPACGGSEGGGSTATLTRLGAGFALAPYDGSLVVTGRVAADGTLSGILDLHPAQAVSAGGKAPARPAQTVAVTGRVTPDAAQVAYAAPGCSGNLTLARVRPPVF
jgi:hypothetical protein